MIDHLDRVVEPDPAEEPLPAAFMGDCGFLTGAAGCIDGDAVVAINRAGKGWKITLRDLFVRFHRKTSLSGKVFDPKIKTYVRALCGDTLHQHEVKNVVASGLRMTLLLRTRGGKEVRLTADHEVCVGIRNGTPVFRRADALRPGDEVLTNGRPAARDALGRKIDSDGYVKILLPALRNHPRWTHEGVYEHILVVEQRIGRFIRRDEEVHHKNEIKHDNRDENLELLSGNAHKRHHAKVRGYKNMHGGRGGRGGEVWFVPNVDQVLSIGDPDVRETYDIVCADPHRNFVANGIVVHNCGKTWLSKALCSTRPGWTMAASTGIAAVNLGEATTINSLLGYFDEDSLRTSVMLGHTQAKIRKLWKSGLERIILDEVSMVSADSLDLIVQAIDEVNGERTSEEGRIGLTLVGDYCQLPPVPEKVEGQRKNKPAKYAFEATSWSRFAANVTTLTEIKRQADPAFIEALRACRRGDLPTLLEYFAPRCQMNIEQGYPGLTIFSKNDQVARWNEMMHRKLTSPLHAYRTIRVDQQKGEWKTHIPDVLQLREGALVMVLANKIVGGGESIIYANGDLGEFTGTEKRVVVTVDDQGKPLPKEVVCAKVRLQRNGLEVWVEPVVRQYLQPTGAMGVKKDAYEVLGSIEYLPLRLAYASTVHKIQGLSMDHVQVAFADPFFGSPSMLYVAFSRARSAEGLRIVGTPQLLRERCSVDTRVLQWL